MKNMNQVRVLCVGVHILDTLGTPVSYLPDGQNSLRIDRIMSSPAGTAAGTAVDYAIMGADVSTVGAIGNDAAGDFLVQLLQARGIDTSRVVRETGAQTSASILLIRDNGDRPALHVRGANATTTWSRLDTTGLEAFDIVHFGGLDAMASLDRDETASVMKAAHDAGALVTLDFQSAARYLDAALLTLLAHVDVFMPNLEQAIGLTGLTEPAEIAESLLAHGAKSVIITCGEDGVYYADGISTFSVAAVATDVVDTTGCGDSISAVFGASRLVGYDVKSSLTLACTAASLVASGLGSQGMLSSWNDVLERAALDSDGTL